MEKKTIKTIFAAALTLSVLTGAQSFADDKHAILKKKVENASEGLIGTCEILEDSTVVIRTNGEEITRRALVQSLALDDLLPKISQAFDGKLKKKALKTKASDEEKPIVHYIAFTYPNGVIKAKILKRETRKELVLNKSKHTKELMALIDEACASR